MIWRSKNEPEKCNVILPGIVSVGQSGLVSNDIRLLLRENHASGFRFHISRHVLFFSSSFYRDRKKTKVQFGFVFGKISINQEKTRTMAFSR